MPEIIHTVVIDPGHGGSDPGAIGPSGIQEKVITLQVAQQVYSLLASAGYNPIMTRTSDQYVSLEQRAQKANAADADVFVSIHCNANANRGANGTETYHFPGSADGEKLAEKLQSNLVAQLKRNDRGIRNANFAVLRETKMPAALVEIAFISNPAEESLLETTAFQKKAAGAIVSGIMLYLGIPEKPEETAEPLPPWATQARAWAMEAGISDGTRPDEPAKRAEVWEMLRRLSEKR